MRLIGFNWKSRKKVHFLSIPVSKIIGIYSTDKDSDCLIMYLSHKNHKHYLVVDESYQSVATRLGVMISGGEGTGRNDILSKPMSWNEVDHE